MSDWSEVEFGGKRIRWRRKGGDFAAPDAAIVLECWHEGPREWRPVRNLNSREWFAVGLVAGQPCYCTPGVYTPSADCPRHMRGWQ